MITLVIDSQGGRHFVRATVTSWQALSAQGTAAPATVTSCLPAYPPTTPSPLKLEQSSEYIPITHTIVSLMSSDEDVPARVCDARCACSCV